MDDKSLTFEDIEKMCNDKYYRMKKSLFHYEKQEETEKHKNYRLSRKLNKKFRNKGKG